MDRLAAGRDDCTLQPTAVSDPVSETECSRWCGARCHPKLTPPPGDQPGLVGVPTRVLQNVGARQKMQTRTGGSHTVCKKGMRRGFGFRPRSEGQAIAETDRWRRYSACLRGDEVKSHCAPDARVKRPGTSRQVQVTLLCVHAACSNHSVRAELIRDLAGGIIGDGVGKRRNNGLVRALQYPGSSARRVRIEVVGEKRTLSQTVTAV